ncbi:MAG: chemotaxis response regulator protein-glutamate methylesterase [Clostridia bacterium]|nr:chemotaxis response regulator protein-glutamate methylesterase [Clostridia bacterium]
MHPNKKIRVLIVDDSAVFRGILSVAISSDPELEVVATATDPFDASDKITEYDPDVMVCDVVMPKMDGIEFIRRLMPQYPLRVVVISSVSANVLDAMNAGAVDFVAKPDSGTGRTREVFLNELRAKIKIAATANISRRGFETNPLKKVQSAVTPTNINVIAIGASTGGTEALFSVLRMLPPTLPGIVIVQHIPPVFSRMFSERMNSTTQLNVKEAENGDVLERGKVLIAPGDKHLRIKKTGGMLRAEVFAGEKVNGHCPSVDVLFESVAAVCGSKSVGIILTGMGSDGAKGLLALRNAGARTLGQDEASSVVYGMPKTAYEIGAVEKQVPLSNIPQAIIAALKI